MQQFYSADTRHDFGFDNAKYWLPILRTNDLEELATFADLDRREQPDAMTNFIAARARSYRPALLRFLSGQRSASAAVRAMSPRQVVDLFTEWTGGDATPGESSGSADTQ